MPFALGLSKGRCHASGRAGSPRTVDGCSKGPGPPTRLRSPWACQWAGAVPAVRQAHRERRGGAGIDVGGGAWGAQPAQNTQTWVPQRVWPGVDFVQASRLRVRPNVAAPVFTASAVMGVSMRDAGPGLASGQLPQVSPCPCLRQARRGGRGAGRGATLRPCMPNVSPCPYSRQAWRFRRCAGCRFTFRVRTRVRFCHARFGGKRGDSGAGAGCRCPIRGRTVAAPLARSGAGVCAGRYREVSAGRPNNTKKCKWFYNVRVMWRAGRRFLTLKSKLVYKVGRPGWRRPSALEPAGGVVFCRSWTGLGRSAPGKCRRLLWFRGEGCNARLRMVCRPGRAARASRVCANAAFCEVLSGPADALGPVPDGVLTREGRGASRGATRDLRFFVGLYQVGRTRQARSRIVRRPGRAAVHGGAT